MAEGYQFIDIGAKGEGIVVAAFDNQVAYCTQAGATVTARVVAALRDLLERGEPGELASFTGRIPRASIAAADYIAGWRRLEAIRAKWDVQTAEFDAVLLPTSPILPPDAQRLMTDNDYYVSENLLALRNTRIGNLMGGCVLTLPTAQPSCGISIMAGPRQEERLLRLGKAAERALA
mgnify:CR=1 FL=1